MKRFVICSAVLSALLFTQLLRAEPCKKGPYHDKLIAQIQAEFGKDAELFVSLCADRSVLHPPSNINTWGELRHRLMQPEVYRAARHVYLTHSDRLRILEETSSVPPEIILAVTSVESLGGSILGHYPVLVTLYNRYQYQNRKKALIEIHAFLRAKPWIACGIGPMGLLGSSAGAFGIAQFTPWAYENLAVDGDGDGTIDLCSWPDSMASVASYLQVAGWQKGDEESHRLALQHYNHSTSYVSLVLDLAGSIRPHLSPFAPPPQ